MNKTIYRLAVALLLLTTWSCVREPEFDSGSRTDGKVRMQLQLKLGEGETQTTRAVTDETTFGDDIYVLVLDGNQPSAKLRQKPVRASEVKNNTVYAVLDEQTTPSYVCLLAATMIQPTINYLDNAAAGTTLAELQQNLVLPAATTSGLSLPLPMSGMSGEIPKITNNTSYSTIPMIRATARIDVVIDAAVLPANFTLTGMALATGARTGWLLQPAIIPVQSGSGVVQYDPVTPRAGENKIEGQVYCYENNGKSSQFSTNPTRIVVIGKYNGSNNETFYGINIAYAPDAQKPQELSYDIDRNKCYTVKINKVQKSGFASLEEAVRNSEFNMAVEAEILVTDPYAHEIVTNGKQYLGATNSAFLVHPSSATASLTGVAITTISYTTQTSWSVGQIKLPPGLSFTTGTTGRLELGSGNAPVVREIIVDIPSTFTEGDIEVTIGNLAQTIQVRRSTPISALGGICEDFATPDFRVGEVVNPSAETAWVQLSDAKEPDGESALLDKITVPQGAIYVHFDSNVGFEGTSKAREAQLYISGGQGKPRTRILVQQSPYEIYKDATNKQIEKAYVGTYHRWNQTGERVIRIDQGDNTDPNAVWTATIVAGKDFIKLSDKPSPDNNIYFNDPYGDRTGNAPQFNTDDKVEANCQVEGNATTVSGTGQFINFRVGLKSQLASAEAQPRYGLIAVIHSTGNHLIYVRQGEAPDYLMRPWDSWREGSPLEGVFGTEKGTTRNQATKICVYNLSDPTRSPIAVDRGKRGYGFTDYPSQGGYYFTLKSTKAFPITANGTGTQSIPLPNWSEALETCPRGYRHATDAGKIVGSESRLSLWLYPRNSSAASSITNQYRGYLADGYFDRRTIVDAPVPSGRPAEWGRHVQVYEAASPDRTAFHGSLLYNPNNLASIFIPEAGSLDQGSPDYGYGVEFRGFWGGFCTSTRVSPTGGTYWIVNSGMLPTGSSSPTPTFDIYDSGTTDFGWSVRCVKDENPPILNPDDENTVNPFPGGEGEQVSLINHPYSGTGSLESQLSAAYPGGLDKVSTIYLYGDKALGAADYNYLNSLATGKKVRHIVLSGAGNKTIPAGAFTSSAWVSIALYETDNIADGAFAIPAGSALKNLKFGNYDAITISANAFGAMSTTEVNLFLAGAEYATADKTAKTWRGVNWYTIKNYYGNE